MSDWDTGIWGFRGEVMLESLWSLTDLSPCYKSSPLCYGLSVCEGGTFCMCENLLS